MKAMVLAAGLGTRLRPLTDSRPKALVEIGGRTLLEITISRLREFGIRDVIVNVHHFADMVLEYVKAQNNFGVHLEISREEVLLDTGGGLKKAAWFFRGDPTPFILHNVDVISTIDLGKMMQFHVDNQALVTLASQDRKSSRHFLFDDQSRLCGWRSAREERIVRPSPQITPLAFAGIHVISPGFLEMMNGEGAFSIVPSYLDVAARGEKLLAFRADPYYWRDLGRPENVAQAVRDLENGLSLPGQL